MLRMELRACPEVVFSWHFFYLARRTAQIWNEKVITKTIGGTDDIKDASNIGNESESSWSVEADVEAIDL